MHQEPASPDPGPDGSLPGGPAGPEDFPALVSPRWQVVPTSPDWDEGYLADEDEPGDPDLEQDPDNAPPAGLDGTTCQRGDPSEGKSSGPAGPPGRLPSCPGSGGTGSWCMRHGPFGRMILYQTL